MCELVRQRKPPAKPGDNGRRFAVDPSTAALAATTKGTTVVAGAGEATTDRCAGCWWSRRTIGILNQTRRSALVRQQIEPIELRACERKIECGRVGGEFLRRAAG